MNKLNVTGREASQARGRFGVHPKKLKSPRFRLTKNLVNNGTLLKQWANENMFLV